VTGNFDVGKIAPNAETVLALERTMVAYERTLLAWVRTAVSLITFGFSIQQFFRIQTAKGLFDERLLGPQEFGLLMVISGLVALVIAILQNKSDIRALEASYSAAKSFPAIHRSRGRYIASLIVVLGIVGLLSMAVR
jgi:putative membrane protein